MGMMQLTYLGWIFKKHAHIKMAKSDILKLLKKDKYKENLSFYFDVVTPLHTACFI